MVEIVSSVLFERNKICQNNNVFKHKFVNIDELETNEVHTKIVYGWNAHAH